MPAPKKTPPDPRPTDPQPTADAKRGAKHAAPGAGSWLGRIAGAIGAHVAGAPKPDGAGRRNATSSSAAPSVASLQEQARATRAGRTWNPDDPLSKGRNAHHTNTPQEMRDALTSEHRYNWLEGDLRVKADGTPVMSHDADTKDQGLTLDEWLTIGAASQRGMKVDVKEPEAIPKLLDQLEKSGIPDGRLMINVAEMPERDVREIRRRFPDAWIALNPPNEGGAYTDASLQQTIRNATAAGGRIAFPLRWDIADDATIAKLKPHGAISIWTDKGQGTPDDTEGERRRLQARGVDGVIDLGPPSSIQEKALQRLQDVWESGPVRDARGIVGSGVNLAKDGYHAAVDSAEAVLDVTTDGAEAVLDFAGDAASHLPLVGGLFD